MARDPDFTQYSSVLPLIQEKPSWMKEEDADRIASYAKYEEVYWQRPNAYKMLQRGSEAAPIYVPNAMTIVDSTAHYFLKGLQVVVENGEKGVNKAFQDWLDAFLKRERFYSRFMVAKHSGVTRGDWIMHVTADQDEIPGSRVSITSVDPAAYFPEWDPDDVDKRIGVRLAEPMLVDGQERVKEKRYWYEGVGETRSVWVEEAFYEVDGWGIPEREKKWRQIISGKQLPPNIRVIPVYHFKNRDWQGRDFGTSELAGFERLLAAVNQAITDEELALALHGLGVYATDAGPPVNPETNELEDWEISPARVMEVPSGAYFRKVEGITSVQPFLDHVKYVDEKVFEASSTFRAGQVDVAIAESGIALAIRFLPQLAKLEHRDLAGVATLDNLFHDLKEWFSAFEIEEFEDRWLDLEVGAELGAKLPENRTETLNELNNMLDRKVISRKYYREKARRLGYEFPDDIEDQVEAEAEADIERQRKTAMATGRFQDLSSGGREENKSNNKNRPNESGGTEAQG